MLHSRYNCDSAKANKEFPRLETAESLGAKIGGPPRSTIWEVCDHCRLKFDNLKQYITWDKESRPVKFCDNE